MRRARLTPLLAVGFAVSACGGGGGGSSSSAPQEPPRSNGSGNGGNPPPPPPPPLNLPTDIPLAIYENHPTNKAVYDATPQGQSSAEIELPADTADNNLFTLSDDGRIWFKTSPDDEAKTDSDGDGVYMIRLNHQHNERGFTEIAVTVSDVAIELTPERWAADTTEVEGFGFTYEQVKDILPDNEFVQYILEGVAFAVPDDGPVVITWSLVTPDSDLTSYLRPPVTDTQAKIDSYRANLNRAFKEFEDAANLKFIEVADTAETVGHFRIYIGNGILNRAPSTVDSFTISVRIDKDAVYSIYVHEIGHALGLAHPFVLEDERHGGFNVVDDRYVNSDQTIMSYRDWGGAGLQPTDIEALQFLYGDENNDELNGLQAALAEMV